jgi:hypothetical protein
MFPQRRMTTDTPDGNYSQALNLFVRGEGGWVQMPQPEHQPQRLHEAAYQGTQRRY